MMEAIVARSRERSADATLWFAMRTLFADMLRKSAS